MTIYKVDRTAADRALNAACRRAVALIREGHPGVAIAVLYSAGTTAALLLGEAV